MTEKDNKPIVRVECPDCGGYGRVPRDNGTGRPEWIVCPKCEGTGEVPKEVQS